MTPQQIERVEVLTLCRRLCVREHVARRFVRETAYNFRHYVDRAFTEKEKSPWNLIAIDFWKWISQ